MMIIVIIIIVSAANNHSFAFQRGAPWRKSHVIAVVRFVERARTWWNHIFSPLQRLESLHCSTTILKNYQ